MDSAPVQCPSRPRRLRRPPVLLLSALLLAAALTVPVACDTGISTVANRAYCNGELDAREDTIDDLFDTDGDGFFNAASPECQETYSPEELDCNDSNADINPGVAEEQCNNLDDDCDETTPDVTDDDGDGYTVCDADCNDDDPNIAPGLAEAACDGLDNDCNPATLDARDLDSDGYTECEDCVESNADVNPGQVEAICNGLDDDCDALTVDSQDLDGDGSNDCFDCDDNDPDRYPGNLEVCEDGIDQNCDGNDGDCEELTWEGNWTSAGVNFECGGGNVVINFTTISVQLNEPDITFVFVGGLHPGSMVGTVDGSGNFSVASSSPGSCSRSFTFTGSFLGLNSFSGTLTGTFTGCVLCDNQSWSVSATR